MYLIYKWSKGLAERPVEISKVAFMWHDMKFRMIKAILRVPSIGYLHKAIIKSPPLIILHRNISWRCTFLSKLSWFVAFAKSDFLVQHYCENRIDTFRRENLNKGFIGPILLPHTEPYWLISTWWRLVGARNKVPKSTSGMPISH